MKTRHGWPRIVEPEALDSLDAGDPAAQRSRRDLRRLHHAMGTLPILMRALDKEVGTRPIRMLELGAGDGSLALRLAKRRAGQWPPVSITLLDRQNVVDDETLQGLRLAGWSPAIATADVFDWLDQPQAVPWDMVIANLFVHHFLPGDLARLLHAISCSTSLFFCCEPRRDTVALAGSHAVGLLGAGAITREDAVLSVHAGFREKELTAAWPKAVGWRLREYAAGLFSHCFLALRE
ncbi:MAG: hypothetical protein H7274_06610 [Rhodoferax sp.]|nr:hypothetical protein [Rhodoferax sp.]